MNRCVEKHGIDGELASRVDQRVLGWFGHVKRIEKQYLARRVSMAEVREGRVYGVDRG